MKNKYHVFNWVIVYCFFCNSLFGQNQPVAALVQLAKDRNVNFPSYRLFFTDKNYATDAIDTIVSDATIATLDLQVLNDLMRTKPVAMEFVLPYKGKSIVLEMVQKSVLNPDFQVSIHHSAQKFTYQQGLYFRGNVKGEPQSLVALSFFDNEIYGMISTENDGNIVLGRIEKENNRKTYIVYSDRNLFRKTPISCQNPIVEESQLENLPKQLHKNGNLNIDHCFRSYLEADYQLYLKKGSVAATVNFVTAIYNNVATIFDNEQITTTVLQVDVWTTDDKYPIYSSQTALEAFRKTLGTGFKGELAHLMALGGKNLGGRAWLNVFCTPLSTYNFAYSNIQAAYEDVPIYSYSVYVMAHEIGHNIGSPHTQDCSWIGGPIDNCALPEGNCANTGDFPIKGGTIMSYCTASPYGINFANGFGKQPGDLIRNIMSEAICITTNCTPPTTDLSAISTIQNLKIVPNPASDYFSVQLDLDKEQKLTFFVKNIFGQVIFQEEKTIFKENMSFDSAFFPSGLYFLNILTEDQRLISCNAFLKVNR
jgi:Metallo-peptidase family M12/Secretion system C-terminal sorting domain/Reprolysin family propeptide